MQAYTIKTLGGTAPSDDSNLSHWQSTLFTNPVAVDYKLRPIYDLLDPTSTKYEGVKEEVDDRLDVTAPKDPFSLLAIRVPLKNYFSDYKSGGKWDIVVAYPDVPAGWLRVGQFAQPGRDSSMQNETAIAVRVNPNFRGEGKALSVVPAIGCKLKWKDQSNGISFGMFTPIGPASPSNANLLSGPDDDDSSNPTTTTTTTGSDPDGGPAYFPLGDIFEPSISPEGVPQHSLESLAVFHKDVLVTKQHNDKNMVWIWDDADTGGTPDISVWGAAVNIAEEYPPRERRMVLVGQDGGAPAYLFQATARCSVEEAKEVQWKCLDWRKVKWLDNKWL